MQTFLCSCVSAYVQVHIHVCLWTCVVEARGRCQVSSSNESLIQILLPNLKFISSAKWASQWAPGSRLSLYPHSHHWGSNVHCYIMLLHGCWGVKRKSSWSHTCYWLSFLPNPRLRDGRRELSKSNHSSGQIMRCKLLNQSHFRGVLSWFRTGNREKLPPHDSFKNWWRKFCLGQPHTFPHYSLDKE